MGNMLHASLAAALMAAISTLSAGVLDPNRLDNPGFATNLDHWAVLYGRPAGWSPLNAGGAPGSGSAWITHVDPGNGGTQLILRQCLVALAGDVYRFGGEVMIPAGQPEFTYGMLIASAHENTNCTGPQSPSASAGAAPSPGTWGLAEGVLRVPDGFASVSINLGLYKPNGVTAPATAQFDNLFVELDSIFGDGFDPADPP